jgi:P27 family predicted phage terminase small subunit
MQLAKELSIMGKRGPAPDPIPLKILKGRGGGKDSIGRPIPAPPPFERAAPDPPAWLEPEARELWDRVAPTLDRLDLLKPEDWQSFICYCETWATWREALHRVRVEGLILDNPKTGMPHKNPAMAIVEAANMQLLRYAQQFGLTPAAEVALAKPTKPVTSDDDKFSGA